MSGRQVCLIVYGPSHRDSPRPLSSQGPTPSEESTIVPALVRPIATIHHFGSLPPEIPLSPPPPSMPPAIMPPRQRLIPTPIAPLLTTSTSQAPLPATPTLHTLRARTAALLHITPLWTRRRTASMRTATVCMTIQMWTSGNMIITT